MSFKNNSPTFSYISWNSCYITYEGVDYIIEDGYTCQKYIYWNYNNNPYKFETTNLLQDETITKQLIAINDKGMATTVELDNITLTFTESGSSGVSGQITSGLIALYDKQGTNTNYEEKFTTIETSIDEITTLMGELQATDDGLTEQISSIQQTAENISMEVSSVKKEYSKDKEFTELRDKIGEALIVFNSELGLFTTDLNEAMKDNSLSSDENTTLTTRVNNLKKYKSNIDTVIDEIVSKLSGEGTDVTALKEEQTVFGNAFNSLMTIYDTVVADNTFTTSEITTITGAIGNMNTRCISLGNVLEDSILLPFDGKLIEEIAKFSIKSNEIMLGVSEIEKSVESNSEKIAELKITSEGISSNVSKVETKIDNIDEIVEDKIANITVGATNLLTGSSEEWKEITVSSVGTIRETFHCSELELNVGEKIAFGVDINATNKDLSARIDFWSDLNGTDYKTYNGNTITKGNKGRSFVISEIPEGYEYITLFLDSEDTTTTREFFKCEKLERGSIATDWSPSPKDTETRIDDALNSFVDDWEGQIDGVVQTYAQSEDPSNSWDVSEKENHEGDIWYDTISRNTYRWDGSIWVKFENEDAILASELAQTKAQIFVSTPTPPYYKNDIWITDLNGGGVVKTCINERLEGDYDASDWVEGLKYTDDTKANELENDLHNNYSTTVEMHSAIEQTAEGILSTVSEAYYTKDDVDGQINLIEGSISEIKQTSDSFSVKIEGVENSVKDALTSGTSTQYYLSTSTTDLSGGAWQDTAPTWEQDKYMWQRMKYLCTDGSITYGTPVCISGAKGADGKDGEDGTSVKILGAYTSLNELNLAHPNNNEIGDGYIINGDLYIWTGSVFENVGQIKGESGADGKTSYFHVKYSDDAGSTFTSNNGETVGMYIGTCVDFNEADPTTTSSYKWALIRGEKGIDGADGVNGQDGTSIVFKGSYSSHPSSPQNGWAYYNTTEKKSYIYQSNTWYQMTIDGADGANGKDGADGLSLEYKGELATPPTNPIKNWAYKDTDNGIVYIYTGSYWEVLTYDGNDGVNGTNGTDGNSVFITYNSSTSTPSTPTGDGTTNGWHTAPTSSDIWMSQKISSSSTTGTWGAPIKIKGESGADGQSLVSSTPEWYKSTSSTSQTGGSWTTTMPTVATGYYIWLRYKQVWENPTAITYTTPVLEQVAESVKDVINKQSTLEQDLDGFKTTVSATYQTQSGMSSYPTTTQMNTAISQSASSITSTVSSTYATKTSVNSLQSQVTQNTTNISSKVSAGSIISTINQSAESVKINAGKIQLEGAVAVGDSNGNYVHIENANYTIRTSSSQKAFFGFKSMGYSAYDNYVVPKLAMGNVGYTTSHNYFTIVPYAASNNPQSSSQAYVDLAYHSLSPDDYSNIKMYNGGDIRIAPIKNLVITTNYVNGSYSGTGENELAVFSTASSSYFNSNLQIGCLRNMENGNGLILADDHNSGNDGARVRVHIDSSGAKFFRPLTTAGNIELGSASYRWSKVYSVNADSVSSDRRLKENIEYLQETPNTLTTKSNTYTLEDMYDFVKDTLFLASYNYKIGDKSLKFGFIAQDLLNDKIGDNIIEAQQVVDDGEEPYLGYDIMNYTHTLAGALKLNIKKSENMQEEINALKNEILELKEIINELKK